MCVVSAYSWYGVCDSLGGRRVTGIQLASSEICVVGGVVFGQAAGVYRFDVVSRYLRARSLSVCVVRQSATVYWTSRAIAVAPRVIFSLSVGSVGGRAASVSRFYGGRRPCRAP